MLCDPQLTISVAPSTIWEDPPPPPPLHCKECIYEPNEIHSLPATWSSCKMFLSPTSGMLYHSRTCPLTGFLQFSDFNPLGPGNIPTPTRPFTWDCLIANLRLSLVRVRSSNHRNCQPTFDLHWSNHYTLVQMDRPLNITIIQPPYIQHWTYRHHHWQLSTMASSPKGTIKVLRTADMPQSTNPLLVTTSVDIARRPVIAI